MRKAAFLDRDGVINANVLKGETPCPPSTINELVLLDGVVEAIHLLKINDFVPIVITNQPDVARGTNTRFNIEQINEKIRSETGIDHFYVCFHDDIDNCECRKPKPGLLTRAAIELKLDISNSFLVGDRWKDISAGFQAGVSCFFIDYSYREQLPKHPFTGVSSLLQAVNLVIGEKI